MKIFISGKPKSGKTTLVKTLVQEFKEYFLGFWTEEITENNKRIGFKVVTTWNEQKIFAHVNFTTPYRVGKYFVRIDVLDEIIEKLNQKYSENKILIIDEIGKMEFYSKKFVEFINDILNKDINLLAVIHRQNLYMVNSYIWLENNWNEVYYNVKKEIKKLIEEL